MALGLYKFLLRLFPRAFRAEYGDEMERVFQGRWRERAGLLSTAWIWAEIIPDTLLNAAAAQWDVLSQDVSYWRRSLARAPGFAITVISVIAVGVGATTAVFSITDHVLVRPLPFSDPDRLVKLWENVPQYNRLEPSPANYRDWREASTVFESMAPFHAHPMNLLDRGDPVRLEGYAMGPEVFEILSAEPLVGRTLREEDAAENAPDTIVLGFGLWQGLFGGDLGVVGEQLRLDGTLHTVVGVMPRDFVFPNRGAAYWVPKRFAAEDFEDRNDNYLHVLAKLAPGVSLDQARAEMEVVTERLERAYPEANKNTRATVVSLRDAVTWRSRMLVLALSGAALCVLLIACTNLMNLFLTRGVTREPELMVRTALGGGRERLVRQLTTETMLLSTMGGGLAVVLAAVAVPLLSRLVPVSLPMGEASVLDSRVLAFAVAATILISVASGVLPALFGNGSTDLSGLRDGIRAGVSGRKRALRRALVVVQVAATIVLLVGSGLLVQALVRVQNIDPGFETEGVVAFNTPLSAARHGETAKRAAFYDRVLAEIRRSNGVVDAAYVSFLPMVMRGGIWPVEPAGSSDEDSALETASLRFVTPRFFSTMAVALLHGRDFESGDTEEAPDVAVVSASFAKRYWPGEIPLGRRFQFAFREREVVGVVSDIRVRGLERESEPQVYLPHQQVPDGGLAFYMPRELVVRAAPEQDLNALASVVRDAVRGADPDVPVAVVRTLADVVSAETASRSTQIAVLVGFASLSMFLSAIGIYGLLAFGVAQRRTEIGVRIALGARSSAILSMVMREGVVLALVGCAVGVVAGYLSARTMVALLAGVPPDDAMTYLVAAGWAIAMTLAGSLVPAMRATRVDPIQATRAD